MDTLEPVGVLTFGTRLLLLLFGFVGEVTIWLIKSSGGLDKWDDDEEADADDDEEDNDKKSCACWNGDVAKENN